MTTDNLPPLPQPEFDNLLDHIYEYGTLAEGTIPRARALCEAYARAAILAERERCAKVCEDVATHGRYQMEIDHINAAFWNGYAAGADQCATDILESDK